MKKNGLIMTGIIGAILILGIFSYAVVSAQPNVPPIIYSITVTMDNGISTVYADYNNNQQTLVLPTTDINTIISDTSSATGLSVQDVTSNIQFSFDSANSPNSASRSSANTVQVNVGLIELQKYLTSQIANANNAISMLQANGKDVSSLQSLVSQMNSELSQTGVDLQTLPTSPDPITMYLDVLQQSLDTVSQFNQQISSPNMLTDVQMAQLQSEFQTTLSSSSVQGFDTQIQQMLQNNVVADFDNDSDADAAGNIYNSSGTVYSGTTSSSSSGSSSSGGY